MRSRGRSASSTPELHRVARTCALPALREELRHRLGSELSPAHIRARALERLERLPDGDRLLHGDFHPANLLGRRPAAS